MWCSSEQQQQQQHQQQPTPTATSAATANSNSTINANSNSNRNNHHTCNWNSSSNSNNSHSRQQQYRSTHDSRMRASHTSEYVDVSTSPLLFHTLAACSLYQPSAAPRPLWAHLSLHPLKDRPILPPTPWLGNPDTQLCTVYVCVCVCVRSFAGASLESRYTRNALMLLCRCSCRCCVLVSVPFRQCVFPQAELLRVSRSTHTICRDPRATPIAPPPSRTSPKSPAMRQVPPHRRASAHSPARSAPALRSSNVRWSSGSRMCTAAGTGWRI